MPCLRSPRSVHRGMLEAHHSRPFGLPIPDDARGAGAVVERLNRSVKVGSEASASERADNATIVVLTHHRHSTTTPRALAMLISSGAAVTTLYNRAQLETPREITNVNGGAVPLGHAHGMSGICYLCSTLLS